MLFSRYRYDTHTYNGNNCFYFSELLTSGELYSIYIIQVNKNKCPRSNTTVVVKMHVLRRGKKDTF